MSKLYRNIVTFLVLMFHLLISFDVFSDESKLLYPNSDVFQGYEDAFSLYKTGQIVPSQEIIYIDYVCDPNDESKPCLLDLTGNFPSVEYVIGEGAYIHEVRLSGQTTVVTMGGGQITSSFQVFNNSELYLLGGEIVSVNARDTSRIVLDGGEASIAHAYDSSTIYSSSNSPTRSLLSYQNASIYIFGANYAEGEQVQFFSFDNSNLNLYGERFIYILSTNGCEWADNNPPEGDPGIYTNISGQCLSVGRISGSQVFITSTATENGKVRFIDAE
ncbi:hypothetical protein [Microbulbifer sp. GL-2]|uniref:hypothetical protein n=1 Tax=Microbulbifer sp. GL-2 TaxID=2591606 RepID=UPI00116234C0|nr:hypothetical protein [Microbulbifer sp. GL-2]BBM03599.1 hypothetical protein GL2_36730 [Microbulbifer sp. GL-2]